MSVNSPPNKLRNENKVGSEAKCALAQSRARAEGGICIRRTKEAVEEGRGDGATRNLSTLSSLPIRIRIFLFHFGDFLHSARHGLCLVFSAERDLIRAARVTFWCSARAQGTRQPRTSGCSWSQLHPIRKKRRRTPPHLRAAKEKHTHTHTLATIDKYVHMEISVQ